MQNVTDLNSYQEEQIKILSRRQFIISAGITFTLPLVQNVWGAIEKCREFAEVNKWSTGNRRLSPVKLTGNELYLAGESSVERWDIGKGKREWIQPLDSPAVFRPRLSDNLVICSGRSFLSGWSRLEGKKQWSYKGESELGVPLLYQQHLHFGSGHKLQTIEVKTGLPLWSFETHKKSRIGYAPVAHKDTLFLGAGDGVLYALSSTEGRLLWKVDREQDWQYLRQLAITSDILICGGYHDEIFGLSVFDGSILWRFNAGNFINSQLVHDDVVYFWSPTGWIYALDVFTGSILWRTQTIDYHNRSQKTNWAPIMAELVADQGFLYILAMDHVLHILDLSDGSEVMQYCLPSPVRPFIAINSTNRRFVFGSLEGELLLTHDPQVLKRI